MNVFISFLDKLKANDPALIESVKTKFTHIFESNGDASLEQYVHAKYAPAIIAAAQKEYNDWITASQGDSIDFDDSYAGGGICHLIADKVCDVLGYDGELEVKTFSYDHEVHVVCQVRWSNIEPDEMGNIEILTVDIPWRLYEIGGGYNFEPIPDVEFTTDDISYYSDRYPEENWDSDY